jgi:hypothetical protein
MMNLLLFHPLLPHCFRVLSHFFENGYRNQHQQNDNPVYTNTSNRSAENALSSVPFCANQRHNAKHEASKIEQNGSASQDYHSDSISLNCLLAKNVHTYPNERSE